MTPRQILEELEVFLRKVARIDDNVLPGVNEAASTFADFLEDEVLPRETLTLDEELDDD